MPLAGSAAAAAEPDKLVGLPVVLETAALGWFLEDAAMEKERLSLVT